MRVEVTNRSRVRPQHSNKVTSLSPMRIGNRECISAGCTWSSSVAWSTVESKEEWGKEAHDRHASPSVRTCFFLLLLLVLLPRRPKVRGAISWRGRERKNETNGDEEPDIRRGAQERTGKRDRGTRGGKNWRATEAGNAEPNRAGYRCIGRWLSGIRARSTLEEFCLLLLFFLSPLRSRSLARPPLVA